MTASLAALGLSATVCALALWQLLSLLRGLPRIPQLGRLPAAAGDALPSVSVVVSALDEEATIEPALRSLLALDYPRLQVVAIDDRSTDRTGAILDRLAQHDPRLRVLHVTRLPPGWLGKTHALHLGSQAATGDYLLFTDADVHFDPQALRRAVGHCESRALDHLTVMPQLHVRRHLLASLLLTMVALFFATLTPWRLAASRRLYVGLGAFNLVRAGGYRQAGGHAALRLEVIDDMELGRLLRQAGLRQEMLLGTGTVLLEWYRNTGELVRGLEKNSFAGVDYSVGRAVGGSAVLLLLRGWPLAGLLATSGAAWWLNAGTVVLGVLLHARLLRLTGWSAHALWWWPLAPFVLLGVLWRAVALALRRGGIVWRGTLYPLRDLRAFRRSARGATSP